MKSEIIAHGDANALLAQASSAIQDLQAFTGGAFMASAPRSAVVISFNVSVADENGAAQAETVSVEFSGNISCRDAHGRLFDALSAAIDRLGAKYPGSPGSEGGAQ